MGTDFVDFIQWCAKKMAGSAWPVVSTTTAAGDADSLVDSKTANTATGAETERYKNKWLRVFDSADPTVENIRKIASFDPDTGTFVPVISFTAGSGDAKEYEIHYLMRPDDLKDCINDTLDVMTYLEVLPATLIPDGDMEETNPTLYWKETNISVVAYESTAPYVQFGRNALKVVDSGAGGGYASIEVAGSGRYVPVTPGESLLVWAPVYGDQKGARLTLYDVTNAAVIETGRHDEEGWGLILFTADVPEGCYEVDVRLETITASGTTYWDHVGLLRQGDAVIPAPSWVLRSQEFIDLIELPKGNSLSSDNADNAYAMWQRPSQEFHNLEHIEAHRGLIPLRLQLSQRPSGPLFVRGKRTFPALSADTDETTADEMAVKYGSLYHAYQKLGKDYAGEMMYWGDKFYKRRRRTEGRPRVTMVSPYRL